jgi:hypothetical protein
MRRLLTLERRLYHVISVALRSSGEHGNYGRDDVIGKVGTEMFRRDPSFLFLAYIPLLYDSCDFHSRIEITRTSFQALKCVDIFLDSSFFSYFVTVKYCTNQLNLC